MYILVVLFHVLVCFILMGVVLLQSGKGAEMGASFGGSSQTLFGSRGSATFLSKLTIGAAIFYMLTSLTLTVLKKDQSVVSSVVDTPATSAPETGTATQPTLPTPTPTESKQSDVTTPEAPMSTPNEMTPEVKPETPERTTPTPAVGVTTP